ncbi:MAG: hypothetical protein RL367_2024, partial [Pseudomonadota bacterium]
GWDDVLARFPGIPHVKLRAELIRHQIGTMVTDVIAESQRRIAAAGLQTVDDVRAAGRTLCGFSPAVAVAEKAHKAFMYARLYHAPSQIIAADVSRHIIAALFAAYTSGTARLPVDWDEACPDDPVLHIRHIGDFIAGMTDRYAIDRYREWIGPIELPEGF